MFYNLDVSRKKRRLFGEVVYGEGKTPEHLKACVEGLLRANDEVFITRLSPDVYEALGGMKNRLDYDPLSKTAFGGAKKEPIGSVAVVTAGTSDVNVAEECARSLEYFGVGVARFYDIGVAGIHRLFDKIHSIRSADAIVVCAGMDGALPSVVAGLVSSPVIAVPTSVGYGASFHGLAPLLSMLNACAEGISVVNIDNGYGAAYLAAEIVYAIYRKDK
ncbi:MAG: nickel pincer cofactor biosynthesis protein LarB [Peptoniphilus sp.]|nr:nickel pincer cofactor biosynthesis protein LarB [Peptoniphilus sp.]MDY3118468.1 nickel pincer cofactor biosynthesis protein LarB [Peptoniphilus sp.]